MSYLRQGMKIGRVVDIDGGMHWFSRKFSTGSPGVFQLAIGSPLFVGDILQTGSVGIVTIAFDVGGRAVVPSQMRILVFTEDICSLTGAFMGDLRSAVQDATSVDDLAPSGVSRTLDRWKKEFPGKHKQFAIETAGGVMGGLEG